MNLAKKREFKITCFLLIWRMYKRGKPIVDCILIVFVTLNIVMSIMGDITDLEKDILKTDLDKDTLKAFITATMEALAQKMNSFEEGIVMIEILEAETANLRKIAESKKKSEGSYGQDSTMFKIIYGKDGLKTFAPIRRK